MLAEHRGQHRLNGVERAVYIHREVPVPQLVRHILEQGLSRHTCVVDEKGHRAPLLLHSRHHGVDFLAAGHIRAVNHRLAAESGNFFQ